MKVQYIPNMDAILGDEVKPKNRISKYQPALTELLKHPNNKKGGIVVVLPKPEKYFHTGFRTFLKSSPLRGKQIGIKSLPDKKGDTKITHKTWAIKYGFVRQQKG